MARCTPDLGTKAAPGRENADPTASLGRRQKRMGIYCAVIGARSLNYVADFVIREWNLAPYPGDQAPPHLHHRSDEAFYVLDGALEVLEGQERRILAAGELAYIPAGTVHTFANRGPGSARILVVMTPEIDALITALHSNEARDATDAIWARYNAAVVPAI